jgi:hypothetical protein
MTNEETIDYLSKLEASLKSIQTVVAQVKRPLDDAGSPHLHDSGWETLGTSLRELMSAANKAVKDCRKLMIAKLEESVK